LLDGSGMKTTLVSIAVALALGALTGCDRNPNPSQSKTTPPPAGTGSSSATTTTPSTPANAGTPSAAEKKEGSNPVQGQVDPKQGEQHKDFQQKGAGAGPKPGG
jgi:hypothetical protein